MANSNVTYNETACGDINSITSIPPPTDLSYMSMRNAQNFSSALSSCCPPTGTYGITGEPSDCYVYCNITGSATVDSVEFCVRDKLNDLNYTQSYGWLSKNVSDHKNGAGGWDGRRAGWTGYFVLALGFAGAVWGLV